MMPRLREAFRLLLGLAFLGTPSAAAFEVRLTLPSAAAAWDSYPLATGVPIPRGELPSPANARLLDYSGQELPIQTSALARWPDESVKSLLVQFLGPLSTSQARYYVLEY